MRDEKLIHVIRTYLCVSLLSNCTSHEVVVVSLSLQVLILYELILSVLL